MEQGTVVGGHPKVIALPPLGQAQTQGVNGSKDILKYAPFDIDRNRARNAIRYVFMLTVSMDASDSILIPCHVKGAMWPDALSVCPAR